MRLDPFHRFGKLLRK